MNIWQFVPVRLKLLYIRLRSESHKEFYRSHIQEMLAENPESAVGGFDELTGYENAGAMQFEFLCEKGLQPDDQLLEIGCGVLRAGEYFIEYLEPDNYVGLDISPGAIGVGRKCLSDELLASKRPRTQVNVDLRFRELRGETFDIAISNSVFSHISPRRCDLVL